ncbi:MAG: GMC family oxidoreductase [Planctomycetes bacterium]|nr:GMC family oxidoreductase [Planctomycetota bacterium]
MTVLPPQDRNVKDVCDVVVIGTGAGGAVAASELAESGLSVIMVEEGAHLSPEHVTIDSFDTMRNMMRENGMRLMSGRSLTMTIQGRVVGGTTKLNAGICFRTPREVVEEWRRDFGLTVTYEDLAQSFERVEKTINVKAIDADALGNNNLIFKAGAESLGIHNAVVMKNESGCEGNSVCLSGCPKGARMSTDRSYVPRALGFGAKLYTGLRAVRIETDGHRVTGIDGVFLGRGFRETGARLSIRARAVVVSAGAFATPVLLKKSGLGNRHVGMNLANHVSAGMLGALPAGADVKLWIGAHQGYESSEFREMIIETVSVPLDVLMMRVPGFGPALYPMLEKFRNLLSYGVMTRSRTSGEVRTRRGTMDPKVVYSIIPEDIARLRFGLAKTAEIMFAGGAEEVFPAIHGIPKRLRKEEIRRIYEGPLDPRNYTCIAMHPASSARMAASEDIGAVDNSGEVYGAPSLYVMDSSVLPNAPGVNPQVTIMAFADHLSRKLADRLISARGTGILPVSFHGRDSRATSGTVARSS